MSDGGRWRASIGVDVWKSSQKWSVRRSAVRSIAGLDLYSTLLLKEMLRWTEYHKRSNRKLEKHLNGTVE